MQLSQTLTQRTTLAMTQRMQASLRILRMSNQDLAEYLAEKSLENPCIDARLPSGVSGPRLRSGPEWDVVATLEAARPSLFSHVAEQIEFTFGNAEDKRIAYAFLDMLEPTGRLATSVMAIAMGCNVPEATAEVVLARLQGFEPSGLFARSLAECLLIQAEDQELLTWELQALIENLQLLADGKAAELAELCDCEPEDIPEIAAILRRFNPQPGLEFSDDRPPIFPPDLTVWRENAGWQVELNRSTLPGLRIATDAAAIAATDREAKRFHAQALSEARWLADALQRRQSTLLRIAACVVERQSAFLDHGRGHLRPLSLDDVAMELELHASTVSRAIAGRMIDTPGGALPLKAFFSRAFEAAGEDQSQDSVMQLVQRIVRDEDRNRPLSDTAIAKLAAREGIKMARRTVTKYRDLLGIASSYERRVAAG